MIRALLLCLLLAPPAVASEIHVSPAGNDANPGTLDKPLATLTAAREAVRRARAEKPDEPVTVLLGPGIYPLTESLSLGKADAGTGNAPVVWRAREKQQARISGATGLKTELFQPVTEAETLARLDPGARGKVLRLDLKAAGIPVDLEELPPAFRGFTRQHPQLMELFCNGRRLTVARWPNEGFAHWQEIVDPGSGLRDPKGPKRPAVFSYEGDRPERWKIDEGVWLQGYWARAYLCEVIKIGALDPAKKQITTAVPLGYGLDTWGAKRYFAFNLIEELDQPGEWVLDRRRGLLYLWPPEPLKQCELAVSTLTGPLVELKDAAHVTLRDLVLEAGRANGVTITGGTGNRVIGCTIRNVGRHAVEVLGGTDHGVVGCDIHDTGYGGVILSGGDRKTLTPANHFADNNHIHHTSLIGRTHAGPIRLSGVGMRAAHNLLHHEPHSAVWYQGNDLIMEYNDIYWAHTETTEGGVFYTGYDWTTRGNVIRYNHIHDINDSLEGSPTEVNVVHEDDCSAGTAFIGNLCERVGHGVSICGGPDNVVDNNVFIDTKLAVALSDRGLQWWNWTKHPDGTVTVVDTRNGATSNGLLTRLAQLPYQQPPWTKYPHLAEILTMDPVGAPWYCEVTRNISYGGRFLVVSRGVKPEWVTIRDNWDEGDPGFVDAAAGNYRLKPDAPATAKIGFQPLPLDRIGLVNDGTRATWPVVAEPPPKGWRPRWLELREQEQRMPTGLPVLAVPRTGGKIKIDGRVEAEEWAPGQAEGHVGAGFEPARLDWDVTGQKTRYPSTAWVQADDEYLYVGFENTLNPAKGVSGGHVWGKDDAVELALAEVTDQGIGPILIWRGYPDQHCETSNEAGAPARLVEQARRGVAYAAEVQDQSRWTAELKIPFTAIGVNPKQRNPRLLFNLSVRKTADDLWVMWKRPGGTTWDVRKGGLLWLTPFGDLAFNGGIPSQARLDVTVDQPGLVLTAVAGCEVATWAKPPGSRIVCSGDDLPADTWREIRFSFTADRDGSVTLNLMGRQHLSPVDNRWIPVWTYWDEFRAEGCELVNGDFEQVADGRPVGWKPSLDPAWLVPGVSATPAGRFAVKSWHNGRMMQSVKVRGGQPVTIRAKVRGE